MGEQLAPGGAVSLILDGFPAADGWFIVQVGREHEFERLVRLIGRQEWLDDERFATRAGWRVNIDVIREAVGTWAKDKSNVEACHELAAAGVAAGPVFSAAQVIADPHVAARNMLVELDRTDGVANPVVIPGNPVKMSAVAEGPETRPPWLGEHTAEVLRAELGLDDAQLDKLRAEGVVS